jgi:hypothetical protein
MEVSDELAQRALQVCTNRGWSPREGWDAIVAAGVLALEQPATTRRELLDLASEVAALRFRAFDLDRDNRALHMNVTGYRGEERVLQDANARLPSRMARSRRS